MDPTPIQQETITDLENEVSLLEHRLTEAKERLSSAKAHQLSGKSIPLPLRPAPSTSPSSSNHFLLLLSDSALPLGSFAFSSGLESYLSHTRPSSSSSFASFLPDSISSYASTTLPFALAAHRSPSSVALLDDTLDATIMCSVGRRASTAQGRALLSIWERSFSSGVEPRAVEVLRPYGALMKGARTTGDVPLVSGHLAPLFGAVAGLVGLSERQMAYVFMLSYVKALVSAAVRAGVFGPYQAQRILAGEDVRRMVMAAIDREWGTKVEDAGQAVPVMDLWIGRHEVLYSRIFNS